MRDQLQSLLEASSQPNIAIRVVPKDTGFHVGLEGAFLIVTVDGQEDVAYMEACGGGRLSVDRAEVRRYALRYDSIGALALPVDSSRSLIAERMENMR